MWNNFYLFVFDEFINFLDCDFFGGLVVVICEFKGGVVMIFYNEEFVGVLVFEIWYVDNGWVMYCSNNVIVLDWFEDSVNISVVFSVVFSGFNIFVLSSVVFSVVNSGVEDNVGEVLKFWVRKKKKMIKKEFKECEVRCWLRYIDWFNSFKGIFKFFDMDDEVDD